MKYIEFLGKPKKKLIFVSYQSNKLCPFVSIFCVKFVNQTKERLFNNYYEVVLFGHMVLLNFETDIELPYQ